MLRLIASAALVFSFFSCGDGTFYAEAQVQHVCHTQLVVLQSPVPISEIPGDAAPYIPGIAGPAHLTLSTTMDVSSSVPKIDKLTATLNLEHARLTAADGTELPTVQHLVIDLNPPSDSQLKKLQLVQADAPATAGQISMSTQNRDIDALEYARSGALEMALTADLTMNQDKIDAQLEFCGELTVRYSL